MLQGELKKGTPLFPNPFPVPTLEEQLASIAEDERETLYICPNAWALRHRFVHKETGEVIRARCDSWRCLYCGPRKVDLWRQLVRAAQPVLFVTLTKVGMTVEEAARVRTTVVQRLRRGFKSRDPERKGYRDAYPIEYLAVLERHSNFAVNGFHCHLLVKGVDYLPKQAVSDALASATKGRSYIVDVQRVHNEKAIGYVTKYLTKSITDGEQGMKLVQQEMEVLELDENGQKHRVKRLCEVEVKSRARRICYSRRFFPESVADLKAKLFADIEEAGDIPIDEAATPIPLFPDDDAWKQQQEQEPQEETPALSSWELVECEPFTRDVQEYRRRKQRALREVVADRREQGKRLSRRVLTMWNYQRSQQYERFDTEDM